MDKWLMNNTSSKIIALVLGVLLFAVVHKQDPNVNTHQPLYETKEIQAVQIVTQGLDEKQYVINRLEPSTVRIQVEALRSRMSSILTENYKVILDVSGYEAGTHTIPLKYELPDGVKLVSMQPSAVTVELEEVQTKQFDVTIKTKGTPQDGYTAGTPIITPSNRVHVTLPTSEMDNVQSVSAMINIDQANESVIQKQVKLTAYDKAGNVMKNAVIEPSVMQVEIPISKPFKSVPLQLTVRGNLPAGLAVGSVEPSVNQVTLYGPQEDLDQIEFYDGLQIDLSTFKAAGTYNVNLKLTLPSNLEKMEPSAIDVKVVIVAEKERVISNVPITLAGRNDKLKTTITEPASRSYDVKVVGAPDLVDALSASDIQLIANVNDLPPGNHRVTLQVNLPRFVRLVNNPTFYAVILIEDKDVPAGTGPEPDPNPPVDQGTAGEGGSESEGQNPPSEEQEVPSGDGNHGTETPDNGSNA